MAGARDRPASGAATASSKSAGEGMTPCGGEAGSGAAKTQATQQAMTLDGRGASRTGASEACDIAASARWHGASDAGAADAETAPSDSTEATPISIRMNRTNFTRAT